MIDKVLPPTGHIDRCQFGYHRRMSMKRVIRLSAGAAVLAASIALAAATPPAMASARAGSTAASDPAPSVYVVGTVRAGVESGCKVLVTPFGAKYVLVGGNSAALPEG